MDLQRLRHWLFTSYYEILRYLDPDMPGRAKRFLHLFKNVNLFVSKGSGFGDQALAAGIAQKLREIGYAGRINIIGHLQGLEKMKTLFNAHGSLTKVKNGFYFSSSYIGEIFFIRQDDFARISMDNETLGIFAVMVDVWIASHGLPRREYSMPRLTEVSKAKIALYFKPYEIVSCLTGTALGAVLQVDKQAASNYLAASVLPYHVPLPSPKVIEKELSRFTKWKPSLGKTLQTLLYKMEWEEVTTFPIYGLDQVFHPEPSLILRKLILSAAKASDQYLLILLLNEISNQSWEKLQALFPTHQSFGRMIEFIDPRVNQTLVSTAKQDIVVLKLGSLPMVLFNNLFVGNAKFKLPSVYEGLNAAGLLEQEGQYGIHCRRGGRLTKYAPIAADAFLLPEDLNAVAMHVCTTSLILLPQEEMAEIDVISGMLRKYQNVTRPAPPKMDRVTYMLSEASKENARSRSLLSKYAFFQPGKNLSDVAALHCVTALRSFVLVMTEEWVTVTFESMGFRDSIATSMAILLRFIVQIMLGDDIMLLITIMVFAITCLVLKAPELKKVFTFMGSLLALAMQLDSQVLEYDIETVGLCFSLMGNAVVTEKITRTWISGMRKRIREERQALDHETKPKPESKPAAGRYTQQSTRHHPRPGRP